MSATADDPLDFGSAVLTVVDDIPSGRVMTYGDVAAALGSRGARAVGRIMAESGSTTCWWRVIRADGRPPQGHEADALAYYRAEGTPLRGDRVDLSRARWSPDLH